MHREVQSAQRLEQLLDGIRQHDGAGGVGQQAGACDEGHDADGHQHGVADALGVDLEDPELYQRVALAGDEEEVQHSREEDDGQDGLQALQNQLEGDLRHGIHRHEEEDGQGQTQRVGRCEQQDDISDGQHQLEPGIKFVHKAAARKMLADGDVSQHSDTPPFRLCSRGRTRLSPASRRCLASRIILTA